MTPARLRSILHALHWSGAALAVEARVDERTVRRWIAGEYPIPDALADWLEALDALHALNPPP